ncbi:MAG: glycosyltransferase family 4 protein [Bdellovibrionota bacterium]
MKILYFTPFYPPQGEAASTRAYWFVKVLKEAGHEVRVLNASEFTLRPASNKDRAIVRLLKENLTGIELFFRILTSQNDRIVLSSPPFFSIIWGAFGAIISGQKYILDVRDLYPEIFFELNIIRENSLFGWVAKNLTQFLYRGAHSVMTVTQGLCREIEKYGEKKPHLVMNGYDPDLFSPGQPEEKFARFTLVFHGTIGKLQNVETLLNLAKELDGDDIDIIVAGDGPKVQDILSAARANIKYLGNISYQEIPALLRKCHVGLSFRTDDKIGKEAFPVKVFEFVGSGLPVIMSPPGEAGRIIQGNSQGLEFQNSEVSKMAVAIRAWKLSGIVQNFKPDQFSRREQAKKIFELM